jgi:hypothetical protein
MRRQLRSRGARARYALADAMVSVAGAAAELVLFGAYSEAGCAPDMRAAKKMLKLAPILGSRSPVEVSDAVLESWRHHQLHTVVKMLRRPPARAAVRRVAEALLERRSLVEADVRRLMFGSRRAEPRTMAPLAERDAP